MTQPGRRLFECSAIPAGLGIGLLCAPVVPRWIGILLVAATMGMLVIAYALAAVALEYRTGRTFSVREAKE